MSAKILDGRLVSDLMLKDLSADVKRLNKQGISPKLVVILAGDDPASLSYIKQKELASKKIGIEFLLEHFNALVSAQGLTGLIGRLNKDKKVHGILVQLPLPEHIDESSVLNAIDPNKDVDGFHACNLGKMFIGKKFEELVPCTPMGVIKLLEFYKIPIASKAITIVGRSNIVGKPLAAMLINRDATITVCHSKTKNLRNYTAQADILVVATGRPKMIKANMVKKGAVVIDVGTTKVKNKLTGDVDFENVQRLASRITPVPGGVGPMTVACLILNTVRAAKNFVNK